MSHHLNHPAFRYASDLLVELGMNLPAGKTVATGVLDEGCRFELEIDDHSGVIHLTSTLAEGPVSSRMMRQLLEANFIWNGTNGAVAGWADGGPVLSRQIDTTAIAYEQFREAAEQFFNATVKWTTACAKDSAATSREDSQIEDSASSDESAYLFFRP